MKVHTVWKTGRFEDEADRLRWFEWWLLIAGVALVDVAIWVNTGTALWQAYEERVFGLHLRAAVTNTPRALAPRSNIVGRLEIPELQLTAMVQEGVDAATLRRAVGHVPGTALPGEASNVALAGHRDTFFRPLRDIRLKDVIQLQTPGGDYRYVVESAKIVSPRDISVLRPTGRNTLTLVTCYPFYYVGSAPKRFVVRAALVPNPTLTSSPEPGTEHNQGRAASLSQ